MLEEFFRRQNKTKLFLLRSEKVFEDRDRVQIVNCLVDFMIEAFGKGNPHQITQAQKTMTARTAVILFVGLKSDEPGKELVTFSLKLTSFLVLNQLIEYFRSN